MPNERLEIEQIPPGEGHFLHINYPSRPGYDDAPANNYAYGYRDDGERAYLRRAWQAVWKRKLIILVMAVLVSLLSAGTASGTYTRACGA